MEDNGKIQAMEKLETEWINYTTALGKHYDAEENSLRMAIFESNELITEETNRKYEQGLISYTNALNHLADLTDEEFNMMNGLSFSNATYLQGRNQNFFKLYQYNRNQKLPGAVDWRRGGLVTSVKNQGECGSCYAFAAAAVLESYYKKKRGVLIDLSPQNIVDCSWDYGNMGCNGGTVSGSFDYAKDYGIAQESKYPYVHTVQQCKWRSNIGIVTVNDYVLIPQGDELALQNAVAKLGPVAVAIHATQPDFRFYKSGIYSSSNCGEPNHAVLVVGYGRHPIMGDYWIVKNRWGTDWGYSGYFHIARNKGNMCGIATLAFVPI
uniref:Cathepsin L-like n=1 Tax=Onchocerca volvulus TaxID=6282 RepID=A0A8R1TS31_ONCVO